MPSESATCAGRRPKTAHHNAASPRRNRGGAIEPRCVTAPRASAKHVYRMLTTTALLLLIDQREVAATSSIPPSTPLLSSPEWTERTIVAPGEIHSFFVRATDIAVRRYHRLHLVAIKQCFHLASYFGIAADGRADPTLQNWLGVFVLKNSCHDLRNSAVVRAIKSHSADGISFGWLGRMDAA